MQAFVRVYGDLAVVKEYESFGASFGCEAWGAHYRIDGNCVAVSVNRYRLSG
jgi:hypothetical protein